jgi:ribosomal protein S18 acetylase RimI-like enzyme
MTAAEFEPWRERTIQSYSAQVSRATGKALDVVIEESRQQLPRLLKNGLDTDGMHVFVLVDEAQREVGWLWLGTSLEDPDAGFVWDVIIDEAVRGQGYGRAAMTAAEDFFVAQGKSRIGLQVMAGNDVARGLYESLGYSAVVTSMSKALERFK